MKLPILVLVLGAAGFCATRVVGAARSEASSDRVQTTYYASGKLETKYAYEDGKRQGTAERWHPNGQLMAQGQYREGRMEGAWQFWNADGTPDPQRSGVYEAGERVADLGPLAQAVHGE
jgi:hypothetical protein